jgi:hypothetical protein
LGRFSGRQGRRNFVRVLPRCVLFIHAIAAVFLASCDKTYEAYYKNDSAEKLRVVDGTDGRVAFDLDPGQGCGRNLGINSQYGDSYVVLDSQNRIRFRIGPGDYKASNIQGYDRMVTILPEPGGPIYKKPKGSRRD